MSGEAPPDSLKTPCTFAGFEKDGQGCYPVAALVFGTKDCEVPVGACFSSMNADEEPPPAPPTPPRKKRKPPVSDSAPLPSKAASERADEATIPDDHADDFSPVSASTTVSPTAAGELSGLVPQNGGSAITVMLALIAVAGGGAGWKFYQSFARQKHEQRMKELEIKEKRVELQAERADDKKDEQRHEACEAARAADRAALEAARAADRAALEEKLAALEARLAEADDVDLPFDPEELNERISQIEKVLKKAPSEKKPSEKKAKKEKA